MRPFTPLLICFVTGFTSGKGETIDVARRHSPRQEICRFCYRDCAASCSVGTCGLSSGPTVSRYKATNLCYSCDAASTLGQGDFALCSAEVAGAATTYLNPAIDTASMADGGKPGAASISSSIAAYAAQETVRSAQEAAALAAQAAREAAGHSAAFASKAASMASSGDQELAQGHAMATQIRASEALKSAQAAHIEWQETLQAYNGEVEKLRKLQLATNAAEKRLAKAEARDAQAKSQYAKSKQEEVLAAANAAATTGGSSAAMAAQTQAMELAAGAQAAQRRLIVAAEAAQEADDKLGLAGSVKLPSLNSDGFAAPTMLPCPRGGFLQLAQPEIAQPCLRQLSALAMPPVAQSKQQDSKQPAEPDPNALPDGKTT